MSVKNKNRFDLQKAIDEVVLAEGGFVEVIDGLSNRTLRSIYKDLKKQGYLEETDDEPGK